MECGSLYRNAESSEALDSTIEILSGDHFSIASIHEFHKVLDFHHAAMMSTDLENQLLDLWAALEGFLPTHDGSSDRIIWYINYILPTLTLKHNEKIFQSLADDLKSEQDNERLQNIINGIAHGENYFYKTIHIVSSEDYRDERSNLLGSITNNPLLRNKVFEMSEKFKKTNKINRSLTKHREKIAIHLQRIYTLRNQIAHNATSLPYIRILVENLHDYFDTIVLSVGTIGRRTPNVTDIHTALETISTIEADYLDSLNTSIDINNENCLELIFGKNNILSPCYILPPHANPQNPSRA